MCATVYTNCTHCEEMQLEPDDSIECDEFKRSKSKAACRGSDIFYKAGICRECAKKSRRLGNRIDWALHKLGATKNAPDTPSPTPKQKKPKS
ncbi:hypothetical protein TWF481_000100 [Arthrobotrys musiformis]|uniref:Stc1 domain-containing protein n=1 Tax=Arthrobotrys musiformis TaxID=47236 RepID=A0AAV9WLY5_9PEZI